MTQINPHRTIRYPHSSQLIQKAISLQAVYTGQTKAQIRERYASISNISPDTIRAWQSGTARPQRLDEILSFGRDAINIANLDEAWLRSFLHAVDASCELRQQMLGELQTRRGKSIAPIVYELIFRNNTTVRVCDLTNYADDCPSETDENLNFATVPAQLGLPVNRPTLLLVGGANGLDDLTYAKLQPLFEQVLVPLCEQHQFTVLDGGTDCGIMRLMGEARARAKATFPLIGVVPIDGVCLPGEERRNGRAPLQPDHTHFVFIPGADWSRQAYCLSKMTCTLTGNASSLTVLANGGEISAYDVFHSQAAGRPIVAIEGSGRLADQFALALRACQHEATSQPRRNNTSVSITNGIGLSNLVRQYLLDVDATC